MRTISQRIEDVERALANDSHKRQLFGHVVVDASVRYYDCLTEFADEDNPLLESDFCSEYGEAWDEAVRKYKEVSP